LAVVRTLVTCDTQSLSVSLLIYGAILILIFRLVRAEKTRRERT